MPKNVSPLPITNDLDKTHLEPGKYQEKLTFDFQHLVSIGLHPDWKELYDWSCGNSVLPELFLAVCITGTENEAHKFSPLIAALSIPENIKLLDLWAESSLGAGQLKKLSDAIQSDGRIFQGSYVVPSEKRARRQFHHKLDDQRIAALLAERIPRSSPDNMEWLSILRLWVLTHAMERALLRNFRDIAIHSVCSKLLMALDNDEGWRSLFLSFHSNKSRKHITSDFDYLSRFISQAANGLLDRNLYPDIVKQRPILSTNQRPIFSIFSVF